MEPWRALDTRNGGMEALNGTWRVCGPVVADSHHFNEDPDQHLSEKLDPVTYESDLEPQPWVKTTGSRRIKSILVNDDLNPKN
jgi:hypothetical protein